MLTWNHGSRYKTFKTLFCDGTTRCNKKNLGCAADDGGLDIKIYFKKYSNMEPRLNRRTINLLIMIDDDDDDDENCSMMYMNMAAMTTFGVHEIKGSFFNTYQNLTGRVW